MDHHHTEVVVFLRFMVGLIACHDSKRGRIPRKGPRQFQSDLMVASPLMAAALYHVEPHERH